MNRSLLISILYLAATLLSTRSISQNFNDLDFGTDTTLDIVTWNIEWFPKDGQTTIYNVANIIEAMDADIIGIQEIDDKTKFGQMISGLEGWDAYFLYGEYQSLAYIYKTSTIEFLDAYEIYTEEEYWREFPRSPLLMEVLFEDVKFVIINNHFKCCGDGELDLFNAWDEETRRYDASVKLEDFIHTHYPDERLILLGDLNDILTDPPEHNVFKAFYDKPGNYLFADQYVAEGGSGGWSYPGWPSHLDHLLITNELFYIYWDPATLVKSIKLDELYPGGMGEYDAKVSDHRPVGMRFPVPENFGIKDAGTNDHLFRVFPNPASDIVTIKCSSSVSIYKLELYSCTGEMMYKSRGNQKKMDVSSFPPGIYLLRIYSDQGNFLERLVLIR